jgi:glycosyltransferase involved in cell wall biosynthesis
MENLCIPGRTKPYRPSPRQVSISVILCTHNPRPDYLSRVLAALREQTLPAEKWEFLLVDNASEQPLAEIWDISWHSRGRHIRENDLGLTPARLRGIRQSRGELLVFVDDDNVLAPDFLVQATAISARCPVLGVFGAGILEPEFEVQPPAKLRPYLPRLALRSTQLALWSNNVKDYQSTPWGAGLCVIRRVANFYATFVEDLGITAVLDRRGKRLFCGGDDVFSHVSARVGLAFGVFPELRITHLISAPRLRQHYLLRLAHGQALSHGVLTYILEGVQPERANLEWYVRLLLNGMKNGLFSMKCRWAESRGKDAAAQFILANLLSPGKALTTGTEGTHLASASRLFGNSDRQRLCHRHSAEREESIATSNHLDKPLVSVIIPAFNAAAYIRQALNSVLAQTYQAIEVIVVDDGSSDATSAVVEEFATKDARFQLVRQSNAGVGAARNTAIRKARGKYIAPLDADDYWFPQKLEKQVACAEQCGDATGLVYCWYTVLDEHRRLSDGHPQTSEGRLRNALILRNVVGNGSVPLFRAAALEKVGLYLTRVEQGGAQGCEDWDLYLRIAERFSIQVVPEYLLTYRQAGSSMSVNAETMAASFAVVMSRARERNFDLPSSIFRWSAGNFYRYLVRNAYHWGYYDRCLRYLKEAVLADPALLLTTSVYRTLIGSLLNITMVSRGRHAVGEVLSLLPEKKGKSPSIDSKKNGNRPFISNRIFENIERRRWSAALAEEVG